MTWESVYLHIPKTAGIAIKNATADFPCLRHEHKTLNMLIGEFGEEIHAAFKFACVRHPCDRFLSAWSYITQGPDPTLKHAINQPQKTYVSKFPDVNSLVLDGGYRIIDFVFFTPQVRWLEGGIVDYVMRFERLLYDWEYLRQRFHFRALMMINRSRHGDWREVLTAETQQRLRRWYADDFRYLGYD